MSQSTSQSINPDQISEGEVADEPLAEIRNALRGLRFGTVLVIVQDGIVVQVDRTEKRRLRRAHEKGVPH